MKELFAKIDKFMAEHESAFYDQPEPFRKGDKEKPVDKSSTPYEDKMNEMFAATYDQIDENLIKEVRYTDFVKDPTKTDRQKINKNIQLVDAQLRTIEQLLNHCIKLKKSQDHDTKLYWKPTIARFQKIMARLNSISVKMRNIK